MSEHDGTDGWDEEGDYEFDLGDVDVDLTMIDLGGGMVVPLRELLEDEVKP